MINCPTRIVIGYALNENYKTPLIHDALHRATRNVTLDTAATFHSDRGSNYTSYEFAHTINELGPRHPVNRTGICFDCETVLRCPSRSDPCYDWLVECPGVDLSAGSGGAYSRRVRVGSDLVGA